MYEYVIQ